MSKLKHKICGGIVKKISEKVLSEKLKKEGLTYLCFDCGIPIKPAEVGEKAKEE